MQQDHVHEYGTDLEFYRAEDNPPATHPIPHTCLLYTSRYQMKKSLNLIWLYDKNLVILPRFRAIAVTEELLDMLRW